MASRPRVRHWCGLSLAVSAVRWCSAAVRRTQRTAWREMHDAGIEHAHSGGPLRIAYMRIESEVFRRIEEDINRRLVEFEGVGPVIVAWKPSASGLLGLSLSPVGGVD